MAKGAYIGVGGVAKKIKKGYIGVDGKARKIKKAYIGIGGVARPCWSGGELAYYGTVTAMSYKHASPGVATAGDAYAIVAAGMTSDSGCTSYYDAYDSSLTKKTSSYGYTVAGVAGASVGDLAVFVGGADLYSSIKTVVFFNKSLTRTITSNMMESYGTSYSAGTTVGDYAIFYGGQYCDDEGDWGATGPIGAYNGSGTYTTLPYPSSNGITNWWTMLLSAATAGNYAVFATGCNSSESSQSNAIAYSSSLTVHSAPNCSARSRASATSIGGYAVFGGGTGSYGNKVEAYDGSLTKKSCTNLTNANANNNAATTIGDYAIFAGGLLSTTGKTFATVDVYDASLVKTATPSNLSTARHLHKGVTIGNFALFVGGSAANSRNNALTSVEAYTIA